VSDRRRGRRDQIELLNGRWHNARRPPSSDDGSRHGVERFTGSPLSVKEVRYDSVVRISLIGELDFATRAQVEAALARAEQSDPGVIELDLGGLTFMDSSAVHLSLEAQDRARRMGHSLVLLEGSAIVQRVFELTATKRLFRFEKGSRQQRGPLDAGS
jgi:anti-sigma B factor antagonist